MPFDSLQKSAFKDSLFDAANQYTLTPSNVEGAVNMEFDKLTAGLSEEKKMELREVAVLASRELKDTHSLGRVIPIENGQYIPEFAAIASAPPEAKEGQSENEYISTVDDWKTKEIEKLNKVQPSSRDDNEAFFDGQRNQLVREGRFDLNPTGFVVDKLSRFAQGGITAVGHAINPEWTDKFLAESLPAENPEGDEDWSSVIAGGLGQAGVQLGATALATYAGGPTLGASASLGMIGSSYMQNSYLEEMRKSGDVDKALANAIAQTPVIALEVLSDKITLGLGKSGTLFKKAWSEATTDVAKAAVLKQYLPSFAKTATTNFLEEGIVGGAATDFGSAIASAKATGDDSYLENLNFESILKSSVAEGLGGAIYGGPLGQLAQGKDRVDIAKQLGEGIAHKTKIAAALKNRNFEEVVRLTNEGPTPDTTSPAPARTLAEVRKSGVVFNKNGYDVRQSHLEELEREINDPATPPELVEKKKKFLEEAKAGTLVTPFVIENEIEDSEMFFDDPFPQKKTPDPLSRNYYHEFETEKGQYDDTQFAEEDETKDGVEFSGVFYVKKNGINFTAMHQAQNTTRKSAFLAFSKNMLRATIGLKSKDGKVAYVKQKTDSARGSENITTLHSDPKDGLRAIRVTVERNNGKKVQKIEDLGIVKKSNKIVGNSQPSAAPANQKISSQEVLRIAKEQNLSLEEAANLAEAKGKEIPFYEIRTPSYTGSSSNTRFSDKEEVTAEEFDNLPALPEVGKFAVTKEGDKFTSKGKVESFVKQEDETLGPLETEADRNPEPFDNTEEVEQVKSSFTDNQTQVLFEALGVNSIPEVAGKADLSLDETNALLAAPDANTPIEDFPDGLKNGKLKLGGFRVETTPTEGFSQWNLFIGKKSFPIPPAFNEKLEKLRRPQPEQRLGKKDATAPIVSRDTQENIPQKVKGKARSILDKKTRYSEAKQEGQGVSQSDANNILSQLFPGLSVNLVSDKGMVTAEGKLARGSFSENGITINLEGIGSIRDLVETIAEELYHAGFDETNELYLLAAEKLTKKDLDQAWENYAAQGEDVVYEEAIWTAIQREVNKLGGVRGAFNRFVAKMKSIFVGGPSVEDIYKAVIGRGMAQMIGKNDSKIAAAFLSIADNEESFKFGQTSDSKDMSEIALAYGGDTFQVRQEGNIIELVGQKSKFRLKKSNTTKPEIDSFNSESGQGGSLAYQIFGTWAANNGKTIVSKNLTEVNKIRRASNMISSFLRHGGRTDHFAIGTNHGEGYILGKDESNLGKLLKFERDAAYDAAPELSDVTYDFEQDAYTMNGIPLSEEFFENVAKTAFVKGVGATTAKRAVLTTSVEQAVGLAPAPQIGEKGSKGVLYSTANFAPAPEFSRKTFVLKEINKQIAKIRSKKVEAGLNKKEKQAYSMLKNIKWRRLELDQIEEFQALLENFVETRSRGVPYPDFRDVPEDVFNKISYLSAEAEKREVEELFEENSDVFDGMETSAFPTAQKAKEYLNKALDLSDFETADDLPKTKSDDQLELEDSIESVLADIRENLISFENGVPNNEKLIQMLGLATPENAKFDFIKVEIDELLGSLRTAATEFAEMLVQMDYGSMSHKQARLHYYRLLSLLTEGSMKSMYDYVPSDLKALLGETFNFRNPKTGSILFRDQIKTATASLRTKMDFLSGDSASRDVLNKIVAPFREALTLSKRIETKMLKFSEERNRFWETKRGKRFTSADLSQAGIYAYARAIHEGEEIAEGLAKNKAWVKKSISNYEYSYKKTFKNSSDNQYAFLEALYDGVEESDSPLERLEENAKTLIGEGAMGLVEDYVDFFEYTKPAARFTTTFMYGRDFKEVRNYMPAFSIPLGSSTTGASDDTPLNMDDGGYAGGLHQKNAFKKGGMTSTFERERKMSEDRALIFNLNHLFINRGRLNMHDYATGVARRGMHNLMNSDSFSKFLGDKGKNSQLGRVSFFKEMVRGMWQNSMANNSYVNELHSFVNAAQRKFAAVQLSGAHQIFSQTASAFASYFASHLVNPARLWNFFDSSVTFLKWANDPGKAELLKKIMFDIKNRSQDVLLDTNANLGSMSGGLISKLKENPLFRGASAVDQVVEKVQFAPFKIADFLSGEPIMFAEYVWQEKQRTGNLDSDAIQYNSESYAKALDETERHIGIGDKTRRAEFLQNKTWPMAVLRSMSFAFATHATNNISNFQLAMKDLADGSLSIKDRAQALSYAVGIGAQSAAFITTRNFVKLLIANALISSLDFDTDDEENEKEIERLARERLSSKGQKLKIVDAEIQHQKDLIRLKKELRRDPEEREVEIAGNKIKVDTRTISFLQDMSSQMFLSVNATPVASYVGHLIFDEGQADLFEMQKAARLGELKDLIKTASKAKKVQYMKEQYLLEAQQFIDASPIYDDGLPGGNGILPKMLSQIGNDIGSIPTKMIHDEPYTDSELASFLSIVGIGQADFRNFLKTRDKVLKLQKDSKARIEEIQNEKK